jgi:hypothetical protein
VRTFDVSGVDPLPRELAKGRRPSPGTAVAWVCQGTQCLPPIDRFEALLSAIEHAPSPAAL